MSIQEEIDNLRIKALQIRQAAQYADRYTDMRSEYDRAAKLEQRANELEQSLH